MREVPEITVNRRDVVVDSVSYRGRFLGVFGQPRWRVCWRDVNDPLIRHCQTISRSCRFGTSELGGQGFSFSVRWFADRRRNRRRREVHDVVSPNGVMQLADGATHDL